MNRKRWILSAALSAGLASGGMACNALVGNDSVSLWNPDSGDGGGQTNPTLAETGPDTTVGGDDGGDGTVDAPIAVESGDTSSDTEAGAEAGSDGAPDSDADSGDACPGACKGTTQCAPNGAAVQTCQAQGSGCPQWVTTTTCATDQSCTVTGSAAACTCNADRLCSSVGNVCENTSTIVACGADLNGCFYQQSSSPCTGSTPVCLNGSCVQCGIGQTQCSSSTQPQTCSSSGMWQNATACSGSTPLCSNGVCVCAPGTTQCGGGGVQTCGSNNQWGTAVACPSASTCAGPGLCETTTGQSCQTSGPGISNCGSSAESCCTSIEVTGGTFYRTYANTGSSPTGEGDPATVSGFRLDKYDVTVGRFRQFVAQWNGGWTPTAGSGKHTHLNGGQGLANSASAGPPYESGWATSDDSNVNPTNSNLACTSSPSYNTWTNSAGGQENLPINCVNWYEAYAFCIWDGGFLPSEAEGEYAAAGGSQQREYPWGMAAVGTACPGTGCQYAIYGCYYPDGVGNCTGVANIAPVGAATLGGGLWGQLDLSGNLFQYELDWSSTYVDPCTDCADLSPGSNRIVRGGRFNYVAENLSSYQRFDAPPLTRYATNGFRCARTP